MRMIHRPGIIKLQYPRLLNFRILWPIPKHHDAAVSCPDVHAPHQPDLLSRISNLNLLRRAESRAVMRAASRFPNGPDLDSRAGGFPSRSPNGRTCEPDVYIDAGIIDSGSHSGWFTHGSCLSLCYYYPMTMPPFTGHSGSIEVHAPILQLIYRFKITPAIHRRRHRRLLAHFLPFSS